VRIRVEKKQMNLLLCIGRSDLSNYTKNIPQNLVRLSPKIIWLIVLNKFNDQADIFTKELLDTFAELNSMDFSLSQWANFSHVSYSFRCNQGS
jgi:hypothetical protein